MKLVRWGQPEAEQPGLIDLEGRVRSVADVVSDWNGSSFSDASLERVAALDWQQLPLVSTGERLGPCVGAVGKLVCVGLNYTDHAKEAGMALPTEPILFLKATSSISGPHDPIQIPRGATKLDWEVELGVVIGKTARYVTEADALSHVYGYCVVNDVSERAFQLERGGQWDKGKSADTFGPLGPWLVTADEIPNPQSLALWLDVDGERRQDSNTSNMVFGVANLVAYISQFMSLQPGDVIATGTPAGVGMGYRPPIYLKEGQTLRAGISGLGEQCSVVAGTTLTRRA